MKKTVLFSFILLLVATTGLHSKQNREFPLGKLPFDRSKLQYIPFNPKKAEGHKEKGSTHPIVLHSTQTVSGAKLSDNWAGFVALTDLKHPEKRSVEVVSGAWVVPAVICGPTNSFSTIWVGIDGFKHTRSIEQIGTAQYCVGGSPLFFSWFEAFPHPLQPLPLPVKPGDLVGAEVAYTGNNHFQFTIMNFSLPPPNIVSFSFNVPGAARNSAEWIVEAPSDPQGHILPLAHFVPAVAFLHCTAKIEGDTGSISDDDWKHKKIIMVSENNANVIKAAPSGLKHEGESFIVVWESPGP